MISLSILGVTISVYKTEVPFSSPKLISFLCMRFSSDMGSFSSILRLCNSLRLVCHLYFSLLEVSCKVHPYQQLFACDAETLNNSKLSRPKNANKIVILKLFRIIHVLDVKKVSVTGKSLDYTTKVDVKVFLSCPIKYFFWDCLSKQNFVHNSAQFPPNLS